METTSVFLTVLTRDSDIDVLIQDADIETVLNEIEMRVFNNVDDNDIS